jgi:glutamate synthase domain-containing protein 1
MQHNGDVNTSDAVTNKFDVRNQHLWEKKTFEEVKEIIELPHI